MSVREFFEDAIDDIDETFGEGYAKQHPELIAGYMQAAAGDRIATQLKHLGNNDAATPMGAIEGLAAHLGEKMCEAAYSIASAIDPSERDRMNKFVADLVSRSGNGETPDFLKGEEAVK